MSDYQVEHWTSGRTVQKDAALTPVIITVNNRAATRQGIINRVQGAGINFVSRSDWAAHKNRPSKMVDDWDYSKIAIHHAGRSFMCGPAALQLQGIQEMQMGKSRGAMDDIGYHYALDCFGDIFEGRDIRFKGENVHNYNRGVIGIVLLENLTTSEEGRDNVAAMRSFLSRFGLDRAPQVPDSQRDSLVKFVSIIRDFFEIKILGGHREFPGQLGEGKICPGNVGLKFVRELRQSIGLNPP